MDEGIKGINDPNEILFISFVSMLYNSGIQQLGKIMNPITGKINKDLAGVQSTIEILKMLDTKTDGNLTENEKNVLQSSLSNLQLNYVEEIEDEKKKESSSTDEVKEEEQENKV
ncbi:MAG: DUF1844 domain-containing protein [Candidatus Aureabacteria bacterium]|nr:DUF1844 domain-containing protein [Candidatus Auribacterota bacterium]